MYLKTLFLFLSENRTNDGNPFYWSLPMHPPHITHLFAILAINIKQCVTSVSHTDDQDPAFPDNEPTIPEYEYPVIPNSVIPDDQLGKPAISDNEQTNPITKLALIGRHVMMQILCNFYGYLGRK